MIKKITVVLISSLAFAGLHSNAQRPQLVVQSFEYIWDREIGEGKHWLDIPGTDSIRDLIKQSFANAFYQRWHMKLPVSELSAKPTSILAYGDPPKFNTKLKDKQPGTWYLFFQVFSKRNSAGFFDDGSDNLTVTLQLKCRIINGGNDSLILDRDLTARVYTEPVSPGQVVLTKLPGYPAAMVKAFDSIAVWLFDPGEENIRSVRLRPACVFSESGFNNEPIAQLEFKSDDKSIELINQAAFSFNKLEPTYTLIKNKKNIAGNTATGILSFFTGVDIAKSKTKIYRADYPFKSQEDTFHCFFGYADIERSDRQMSGTAAKNLLNIVSTEGSFTSRVTDSSFIDAVTREEDTIATFTFTYLSQDQRILYTHLWDGTDSTTILPLPEEWKNNSEYSNILIRGTVDGKPFIMQSAREKCIRNFFVNSQLALSIYGRKLPSKGLLFQELSPEQIKVFTILSSLPH